MCAVLQVAQAKARWGVPVPGEVDSDEEIEDEFDRLNQPPKPSTSTVRSSKERGRVMVKLVPAFGSATRRRMC